MWVDIDYEPEFDQEYESRWRQDEVDNEDGTVVEKDETTLHKDSWSHLAQWDKVSY